MSKHSKNLKGNAIWENSRTRRTANMVVFLASEKVSYITGAIIPVDGGIIKTV